MDQRFIQQLQCVPDTESNGSAFAVLEEKEHPEILGYGRDCTADDRNYKRTCDYKLKAQLLQRCCNRKTPDQIGKLGH